MWDVGEAYGRTIVTFGMKIPAGIFIPTMVAGALFGRVVGLSMQYLVFHSPDSFAFAGCGGDKSPFECIVPGTYAMIGAAAALAGVTRMTVSLAVISTFPFLNALLSVTSACTPFVLVLLRRC